MSGRFMKIKRFVIPTLTMVIIASQLMGCAAASSSEIKKMLDTGREIEIEIATPISVEQGEAQSLIWIQLDRLETYKEFRVELDDIMKIITFGNHSKNGIVYVNLEGKQEGNNTLYNAFMNRKFISKFYEDDIVNLKVQQAISLAYIDVDEHNYMVAAINAYWNLLPDAEPNYFNPEQTLSRLEAMALLARASTPVTEAIGNEAFTNAVGQSEYTDYASLVANDSYLSIDDKSLNEKTAIGNISRGEYIYMLMSNVFGVERINSADIKKAEFNDCKNAGNIASKQKISAEDIIKDYYESAELKYALDNPEKGCPERMFKVLVVAKELGIIGNDTRWDEAITKEEAIQLYIDALQAYTKENGYPVDAVSGQGIQLEETEDTEETEKPKAGGDVGSENPPEDEFDAYSQYLQEAAREREQIDKVLNESTGVEIVEELDIMLYAQQNCNARSGDGTNYEKKASIEKGAYLHVTGRTANDWYRVDWGGETIYISSSLLGEEMPAYQPIENQSPQETYDENYHIPTEEEIRKIIEEMGGGYDEGEAPGDSGTGWTHDL